MNVYNKIEIEQTANSYGFIRDNVEKVMRLGDILLWLNTNPFLSDILTLKGGTAINMIIFNLPRLSVDIDLDFCVDCDKSEMERYRNEINPTIADYMFSNGYALSPKTKNPLSLDSWVFMYTNSAGNRDNIKIEINYSS